MMIPSLKEEVVDEVGEGKEEGKEPKQGRHCRGMMEKKMNLVMTVTLVMYRSQVEEEAPTGGAGEEVEEVYNHLVVHTI